VAHQACERMLVAFSSARTSFGARAVGGAVAPTPDDAGKRWRTSFFGVQAIVSMRSEGYSLKFRYCSG